MLFASRCLLYGRTTPEAPQLQRFGYVHKALQKAEKILVRRH
jgi:hypothetical protein